MVSLRTTNRSYFPCAVVLAGAACLLGNRGEASVHEIPVSASIAPPKAAGVGVDMGNHQDAVRIVLTILPPSFQEGAAITSSAVKDQSGEMIWTRKADETTTNHIWWGEGASTHVDGSVWIHGRYTVPPTGEGDPTFDVVLAVVNARVDNAADHHADPDGHWPPTWPDELADATEATEWGGLRVPAGIIENPFAFPPKLSDLGENVKYKIMEIEVHIRVPPKWQSDTVGYLSYQLTNDMGSSVSSYQAGLAIYVENEEGTEYELMATRNIPGTGLTGENRIRCAVVTNEAFSEPITFRVTYHWHHDGITWGAAWDDILFRPWENGRFVPAVVLKDNEGNPLVEGGRGSVPHIPLNAVLPVNCSGTGEPAKVKFALELDHAPTEEKVYKVSIPEPIPAKADIVLFSDFLSIDPGETVSDSDPGKSFRHSVVEGKDGQVSMSMADSSTVVASRVGSPGEVIARMHLVNYELRFNAPPRTGLGAVTSSTEQNGNATEGTVQGGKLVTPDRASVPADGDRFDNDPPSFPFPNNAQRAARITRHYDLELSAHPPAFSGNARARAQVRFLLGGFWLYEVGVRAWWDPGDKLSVGLSFTPVAASYNLKGFKDISIAGVAASMAIDGNEAVGDTIHVCSANIDPPLPNGVLFDVRGAGAPPYDMTLNDYLREYTVGDARTTRDLLVTIAAEAKTRAVLLDDRKTSVFACHIANVFEDCPYPPVSSVQVDTMDDVQIVSLAQ